MKDNVNTVLWLHKQIKNPKIIAMVLRKIIKYFNDPY
jgi:hypothetical protein